MIFVNDISVTGTQMNWVKRFLRASSPRELHWLLILNVDRRIGCRFPHLESEINNSKLREREEFISFLRESDLRHTGKLIARVLSYDAEDLYGIVRCLDRGGRRALRRAIRAEGVYGTAFFREKMRLVDRAVLEG